MNCESDSGNCSTMASPVDEMEVITTPSVAMANILQADEEEVGVVKEIKTPLVSMENNVKVDDDEENNGLVEDFVTLSVDSANNVNVDEKEVGSAEEIKTQSMNMGEDLKADEKVVGLTEESTTPASATVEDNVKVEEKVVGLAEQITTATSTTVENNDKADEKEKSSVEETTDPSVAKDLPTDVEKDLKTTENALHDAALHEEIKCLVKENVKKEEEELLQEIVTPAVAAANELREEEEEFIDETILERIQGLGEMFPQGLRNFTWNLGSSSKTFVKGAYHYTRVVAFFCATTSLLLFAPAVFEHERVTTQEMMRQERNRAMLGPGMATSGVLPMPAAH